MVHRRAIKTSANGKKRSYSCNHCFAQIVICSECREMFRRLHWNNRDVKSIVWRCISRLESTGLECLTRTINELVLQEAVVKAINDLQDYISQQTAYLTEFDESLVQRWIKQITIWDTASLLN